ncbi:diadenylate cyclase CdaA [Candidatus Magnetominusculus xianensis]|uniref:Diadenylate cyclase n=1 Tax=Candidatus Magnetominusculus xianensis TaxID=1748249 RepID=A0ABR5SEL0_9BACT|nr:diadenylate cyclase CdaA [Candidatus Magnetominusculus xianensis]KWT83382.1 membrane protein [Candidatus Magnetominusculus xianensis]MBF0405596.1 TIGR00159 family protein [Nitrospirota bacterium]
MDIIEQIRWQDILDILLVWLVLYRVLLLIRGTRAVEMLIGIGVLLVMSLIAGYLKIYTIDWLIQSFWAYIVIAVIVLFQPEIRRALAQMGKSSFFRPTSAEELKSLDEIVKAAASLSARKIGALIILERDTSLKDYIEIGTYLDARVTRELLLSIFHPTSPIHDGAVVISGNKIVAAGCFLPITFRPDIDKLLGTRHRAALAVTEETDAVVVIVSEETGSMSTAIAGEIEKKTDMAHLRNLLTDMFADHGKKRK